MYVYTHWNTGTLYTYIYDKNGKILNSTTNSAPSNQYWWKTVNIPLDTSYIIFKIQFNSKIMEIKPQI